MVDRAQLAANLVCVRERIAAAAKRAGRQSTEIKLIGVTKYVDAAATQALFEAGCSELGESRPQSLEEKAGALAALPIQWHMIGPLQRNKVRRLLPHLALLHSGDSLRLLELVNAEAERLGKVLPTLLEVNISRDPAKHGFSIDEMEKVLAQFAVMPHIEIQGLMTMAALAGGPARARQDFAALRQLREQLQRNCSPNIALDELSMGMSDDFAEAILEGATLVRVGSALWEGVVE